MSTAWIISAILFAPFVPGIFAALIIMADELINGGREAHGR
jgi:hypothetical protein